MTTAMTRSLQALLFFLGIGAIGYSLDSLRHIGVANADTVAVDAGMDFATPPTPAPAVLVVAAPSASNPAPDLQIAVDSGWAIVEHNGLILGGGALLYCLLSAILRRNKSEHWIAQGRILALLTGVTMTLGALLDWKLNGGQLAGVIITVIAAIKLMLSPAVAVAQSGPVLDTKPSSSGPGSGVIAALMIVVIGIGGGATLTSCKGVAEAGAATIDCTKLNVDKIADVAAHLVKMATNYVLNGEPIDWHALRLEAQAAGYDIGICAFGPFVNSFLAPDAGRAAPDPEQARRARDEFEQFRALVGGATVHTTQGNL